MRFKINNSNFSDIVLPQLINDMRMNFFSGLIEGTLRAVFHNRNPLGKHPSGKIVIIRRLRRNRQRLRLVKA